MRYATAGFLAVSLAALPTYLPAQTSPTREVPAVFSRVVACASVTDPVQRLACFDREVPLMNEAQRSGELVAMNRQEVTKTRRSLFGLALPDLGIFGGDSDGDALSEIETTIKAARQDGRGRWTIDLAEGGRWVQIDSRNLVIDPKPGQPIRIRRAALGSYLANVNDQLAIRVRRSN